MSQDRQIVYPDAEPATARLLQGSLQRRLDKLGAFTCHLDAPVNDEQFSARIDGAEAIILGHWHVSDAVLRSANGLKIIAYTGIGVASQVNLELANELGIMVCNTPGYANQTVAEHAIALMLAAARQIPILAADARSGGWNHSRPGFDLYGKTLGLVGLGGIGKRTAELAQAFGMDVIAWTAHPDAARENETGVRFKSLEAVLESSDIVSLHLALTSETEGLITTDLLARMKQGALLINTARGEIIDEAALLDALQSGRISAGLDVFHQEPLPSDHPFRQMENVIITPHVGYNTPEATLALFEIVVSSLEAFYAGDPINVVNR